MTKILAHPLGFTRRPVTLKNHIPKICICLTGVAYAPYATCMATPLIGYDTIRDAILSCARKTKADTIQLNLPHGSLIYGTKVSVTTYFVLIGYRHCSETRSLCSLSSLPLLSLRTNVGIGCEKDGWKSKKNWTLQQYSCCI